MRRLWLALYTSTALITFLFFSEVPAQDAVFHPRGKIHIPIGIADTLDTLKTFVEAEGCFSPGVGSYGIYFALFDRETGSLTSPSMKGVNTHHGLSENGYLIPWTSWNAGNLAVKTEVCEVRRESPQGRVFVVGARVRVTNQGTKGANAWIYAAIRPVGPAGWPVRELKVSEGGDALLVDGRAALVPDEKPEAAGVSANDDIGQFALAGETPPDKVTTSETGDCSGALRFKPAIAPGETTTFGFVCPVLPGRRAVGHRWDGTSTWAQLDEAKPNPRQGGVLQPDPGLEYYRKLNADALFEEAHQYCKGLVGQATVKVPDARWGEAFAAITGHVALCLNEGAPDVAVVNYNVFNRDGVYLANILQKSGNFDLAARAIDYFRQHPFSGRVYPEADNPGQILWVMGEHWLFTRDRQWLERIYPSVEKLVSLIRYYRTTKGPHWVSLTSLDFGEALPLDERKELKPGRCDGHHPEYTEAFDVAGLRKAALLAEALGKNADAEEWRQLADSLFGTYDRRFAPRLPKGYGSYAVLWPCRLYPLDEGKAHDQFKNVGAKKPGGWRYFPLATAHQGLLAGNRSSGYRTLDLHLGHEQMRGWYAFDEGGKSGPGGWRHVRTTWNPNVAMPHSWAIAELWLLLRDCLVSEDGERLVLLAGVPPEWFTDEEGMAVEGLPTYFGACYFAYRYDSSSNTASLTLFGKANPPGGFAVRMPPSLAANVSCDDKTVPRSGDGDFVLPPATRHIQIAFPKGSKPRSLRGKSGK
jgi:hypothetical protein